MIQYLFSTEYASQQFVQIQLTIDTDQASEILELAAWRPGRYELGNFAKNIRNFKVLDEQSKRLPFEKLAKDTWKVDTNGAKTIRVIYQYYANELNAGSTYLSPEQLYVNPVNCCMWVKGRENEPCQVRIDAPSTYTTACAMKVQDGVFYAANYEELADSPFISSPSLQHNSYEVKGVTFNLWFQGDIKVEWDRLIKDFTAFTEKQLENFIEFPFSEYHFFFQITTYPSYHGVEHINSTVIQLGPSYAIFNSFYKELMGVSSHELYHAWNVKTIRPIDLMPYDYKKENYSKMGYLCEGVTTYMGDLMLYRSKYFNEKSYLDELTNQIQKHFENFGRLNYSLADSSYDTWLDGYVPGAPYRKVSIYTEGCLFAFAMDVMIMTHSNIRNRLDDVMRKLYYTYALAGEGISEEIFKACLKEFSGVDFSDLFDEYLHGTSSYERIVVNALEQLGYEILDDPSSKLHEARLGFKVLPKGMNFTVSAIYPGGPAELGALMLGDEITGVNGCLCSGKLDEWLNYFTDEVKTLNIIRQGRFIEVTLPEVSRYFYRKYHIERMEAPNAYQKRMQEKWCS